MASMCCAPGCPQMDNNAAGIPFHELPKDPERRLKWLKAMGREDLHEDGTGDDSKVTESECGCDTLCGKHFVHGKMSDDPAHVDFIPTIFTLKSEETTTQSALGCGELASRRRQLSSTEDVAPAAKHPKREEPATVLVPRHCEHLKVRLNKSSAIKPTRNQLLESGDTRTDSLIKLILQNSDKYEQYKNDPESLTCRDENERSLGSDRETRVDVGSAHNLWLELTQQLDVTDEQLVWLLVKAIHATVLKTSEIEETITKVRKDTRTVSGNPPVEVEDTNSTGSAPLSTLRISPTMSRKTLTDQQKSPTGGTVVLDLDNPSPRSPDKKINALSKRQDVILPSQNNVDMSAAIASTSLSKAEPQEPERYMCRVCKQISIGRNEHQQHIKTHGEMYHETPPTVFVKSYTCKWCSKRSTSREEHNKHMKTHRERRPYQVKLKICTMCGAEAYNLAAHMKVFHGINNQQESDTKVPCEVCGREVRSTYMKQHMRQHTDDRPYACQYCNKRFCQKAHCDRHEMLHANEDPQTCELCGKMYTSMTYLSAHMKNFHHVDVQQRKAASTIDFDTILDEENGAENIILGSPDKTGDISSLAYAIDGSEDASGVDYVLVLDT